MGSFHLPPDWTVPEAFVNRLGDRVGRQRVMAADGHLLLLLHEPPKPGETERVGRPIWRDAEGDWQSRGVGNGPQVLNRHVAEFTAHVDTLESMWDEAQTATDHYMLLRAIAPLHRTIRNLHAVLQEARLLAADDRDLINARDSVGELERTIELLHADIKNGLDFMVAHQAELQTRDAHNLAAAGYRLNLMAAIFLPVGTLAAIFGMNLTNGLDIGTDPVYFWGLLAMGFVIGLILTRIMARKPRS